MDVKEQNNMSLWEERNHWWIQTRFCYIDKAFSFIKSNQINALEVGCGTGQNLWYIHHHDQHSKKVKKLIGLDPHAKDLNDHHLDPSKTLLLHRFSDIDFQADLLLAMDVLEHIKDDLSALKLWSKTLKKDGIMLITVPAFQCLWSSHDELLGHHRRYTKSSLLSLIAQESHLRPLYVTYAFGHIFPIAYILRKCMKRKNQKTNLRPSHFLINAILKLLGQVEYTLGGGPFGTSVIGVFQKV